MAGPSRRTAAYRLRATSTAGSLHGVPRCTDAEIPGIIRRVYRDYGYIVDPHTACGFKDLDPDRVSVVLATASPANFPTRSATAIGIEPTDPSLEALKSRRSSTPAEGRPRAIRDFIAAHAI